MEGPTSDYTRRFQVAKRAHGTKKLTPTATLDTAWLLGSVLFSLLDYQ